MHCVRACVCACARVCLCARTGTSAPMSTLTHAQNHVNRGWVCESRWATGWRDGRESSNLVRSRFEPVSRSAALPAAYFVLCLVDRLCLRKVMFPHVV